VTNRIPRLVAVRVRNQFMDWSGAWWITATLVANHAIGPLIGLVVWTAVMPGGQAPVNYYVALVAVQLLTASFENHTFSESIYDGRVSHDLLKPQPVIIGPVGENIAIRLWMGIFGLPLAVVTALVVGASYQWSEALLAVPLLVGAAVLRFLWTWLLALAAFWTERVHAIVAFGNILIFLLGGTAAPIALLPEPLRSIASVLPFHAMLGLPAEVASGTVHGSGVGSAILLQLVWGLVFAVVAAVVWRRGVRQYAVIGA
jgi:ABC-2 type transport system permease protein